MWCWGGHLARAGAAEGGACGQPTKSWSSRGSSTAPDECSPSMRPQCTPSLESAQYCAPAGTVPALDEDPCPREYLLLIALREVVAHAPSDRIKSVALRLVQRLLTAVQGNQEAVADSAAECAGALAAIAPEAVAQHFLDPLLNASDVKHKASAAACAKAATSAKLATDASVAAALVERLEPLLWQRESPL